MNAYQTAYQETLQIVDQLEKLVFAAAALDDSDSHTDEIVACLEIHYDLPQARRALRAAEAALITWGHTLIGIDTITRHHLEPMFRTRSVKYRQQLATLLLRL